VHPDESQVIWQAAKVTGEHTGGIKVSEGMLMMAGDKIEGGRFVVNMSTITCTDLTDPETNKKLVGHLKSDDFFGVDQHPIAQLEITGADHIAGNRHMLMGNITIKGITQPLSFPAEVTFEGEKVLASAKMVLDRSKFDVRYGSGSFFENLGDKLIYDEFQLDVQLVAKKESTL
jgi:polyisoprenoid-binding protein YceI